MRLLWNYRDVFLIAAAAVLATLLAQSSLVSAIPAFLIGAIGPALLPALLLYRPRRQRRHFAQQLLDSVPMPIYVKDADSRYLIVNATLTREWQRPAQEMIGRTSMSLAPSEEIARVMREEDLDVLNGGSVYKEEENYHPVTGKGRFRVVTGW